MGTSLTGLTPATTYDALIKVGDNGPIDGTLKTLSDGLGNNLPMEASTSAINFTSTLTQGGVALQPVLVSGTNIKTINGSTILGSGDLSIPTVSGVAGAIQFSNGSAFASDAANFFWDNTNKSLGIGTNAPLGILHLYKSAATTRMLMDGDAGQSKIITYRTGGLQRFGLYVNNTAESGSNAGSNFAIRAYSDAGTLLSTPLFINRATGNVGINTLTPNAATTIDATGSWAQGFTNNLRLNGASPSLQLKTTAGNSGFMIGTSGPDTVFASSTASDFSTLNYNAVLNSGNWGFGGYFSPSARFHIKGSGSTSATSSLLVQNSVGTAALEVLDDSRVKLGSSADFTVYSGAGITSRFSMNVGSTSLPTSSAVLQVTSTTQGFLPPRMTDAERAAIATPAEGLLLFNTTNKGVAYRDGTNWGYLSGAPQTVAASGGTVNVSFASGNIIDMTLTASTTLTFAGHVVGTYIFELTQGGSGSYTITWPASVKWSGGTAPTLTTAVGKTDIVTLFHDGTNFYGTYSLNY
jgi:hypothetical protein